MGNKKRPDDVNSCVCKHYIEQNCYIRHKNTNEIKILGNCCIRRFMPKGKKINCISCGLINNTRDYSVCKDCFRKGIRSYICDHCDELVTKTVIFDRSKNHLCPDEPIKCEYCDKYYKRKNITDHNCVCSLCMQEIDDIDLEHNCPEEQISCDLCRSYYKRKDEGDHRCICLDCYKSFTKEDRMKNICPEQVSCELCRCKCSDCYRSLTEEDKMKHICPEEQMSCNLCRSHYKRKDEGNHICPDEYVSCDICGYFYQRKYEDIHKCQCLKCNEIFTRENMTKHMCL